MFPKNAWYVACMSEEIDDKPLGRKVCGESHRLLPWSRRQGRRVGRFLPTPRSAAFPRLGRSRASWSAATTDSRWAATARPSPCPASACAASRRSALTPLLSAMASSGCGPATRRRPTRRKLHPLNGPKVPSGPTAAGFSMSTATTAS